MQLGKTLRPEAFCRFIHEAQVGDTSQGIHGRVLAKTLGISEVQPYRAKNKVVDEKGEERNGNDNDIHLDCLSSFDLERLLIQD